MLLDLLLIATPILYLVFNFTIRRHANEDLGIIKRVFSTLLCALIWDILAYNFAVDHPIILGIAFFALPFCDGVLIDAIRGGIEGWRRG